MKILFALACGTAIFAGCNKTQEAAPVADAKTLSVAAIQKLKVSSPIVAQGTMVEKCPVAGCWFKMHDRTGVIKVDLKATKQTVMDVPLNSEVTVRGKVALNGSEKMIRAVSATF